MKKQTEQKWTRKTAAKFWNMPENRVKYSVEYKKIVKPAEPGIGQGNPSYFNDTNMVELGIVDSLSRYGLAIGAIERVFWLLRLETPEYESIFKDWKKYDKLYLFVFGFGLSREKENSFAFNVHPKIDFFMTGLDARARMKLANSVLIVDLGSIFRKVKSA